jgi:hypothetical protein
VLLKPGYLRSGINDDGGNVRRRSVYDIQIVRVSSFGVLQRVATLCDYTPAGGSSRLAVVRNGWQAFKHRGLAKAHVDAPLSRPAHLRSAVELVQPHGKACRGHRRTTHERCTLRSSERCKLRCCQTRQQQKVAKY